MGGGGGKKGRRCLGMKLYHGRGGGGREGGGGGIHYYSYTIPLDGVDCERKKNTSFLRKKLWIFAGRYRRDEILLR